MLISSRIGLPPQLKHEVQNDSILIQEDIDRKASGGEIDGGETSHAVGTGPLGRESAVSHPLKTPVPAAPKRYIGFSW